MNHYPDVRSLLEAEGVENVLPGIETIDAGVERYHSFPGYEERIEEGGIFAIGLD